MWPHKLSASSATRGMLSSAAKSKGSRWTSEPARHAARTGSRLRRSRAERISLAPARAKARARDRPMPEEAPVIHTTFPAKWSIRAPGIDDVGSAIAPAMRLQEPAQQGARDCDRVVDERGQAAG